MLLRTSAALLLLRMIVTDLDFSLWDFMSISMQSVFRYAEIWSLLILLHLTRKQDMRG